MNLKVLLKSTSVSGVGVLIDVSMMYLLGYTGVPMSYQLYISSFVKIIFLFFAHNLITYKGNTSPWSTKALKFFPWELFSLILVSQMILYLNEHILTYIHGLSEADIKGAWFKGLVHKEAQQDTYTLTTNGVILLKQLLIIIFFLTVELYVYKHIFKNI
jgi:putative flippase GtrA